MGGPEFTPEAFLAVMREQIPLYDELEEQTVAATAVVEAKRILELGFGTGETTRRLLARHPGARLVGIDGSSRMLATVDVPGADLRRAELTDPLPEGPFDLVVACLAVHHVDSAAKRDLFGRIAAVLRDDGWFVLGGLIVPREPIDPITPLTPEYDLPDTLYDQLRWLSDAGFEAEPTWVRTDLAVVRARRLPRKRRWWRL